MMLSNGCVCCALGGDLERSIGRVFAARARADLPPPRRFVLETSGLSKPGPILRSLASLQAIDLRAGVVATFDCTRGASVAAFEEAAAQWAGAQAIVLTKRDAVDAAGLAQARAAAQGVNPVATLIDDADRAVSVRAAFALRVSPPARFAAELPATGAHPRLRTLLLRFDQPVGYDTLAAFLDDLAWFCGERLLRVKGVVLVDGMPMLVQSVGTMFSTPRPFGSWDGQSFLVVIVRDLEVAAMAGLVGSLPAAFERMDGLPAFRHRLP
jgi:G3E family GTPase